MPRVSINPNRSTDGAPHAQATEMVSPAVAADLEDDRQRARNHVAALLDLGMDDAFVDARRETPRLIADAANHRKDHPLPDANVTRPMLSSRRKKDYSHHKNMWEESLPKTRLRTMKRVMGDPVALDKVNDQLRAVTGYRSRLTPYARRRVNEIDRSIQDFEATNEREHVVYATLMAPEDTNDSRDWLRVSLQDRVDSGNPFSFDGYIPSTHSLGNIEDNDEIVMEIRTRSGAYVGTSDSTPNADHIIARGRVLQPVAVRNVDYVRPDGTTGSRFVVQMEDITEDVAP